MSLKQSVQQSTVSSTFYCLCTLIGGASETKYPLPIIGKYLEFPLDGGLKAVLQKQK